jgi:hypothetical protein
MRDIDQRLMARELAIARRALPSCQWSEIADLIAADRTKNEARLRKRDPDIDRSLFDGLQDLKTKGVVVHPLKLEARKVAAIRRHLDGLPVYRGSHVISSDHRQRPFAEVQRDSAFAGYTVDQLLRTPHLVDFFNQPAIVDFLEAAFGCVPTLYSLNAWWSFPATIPTGHGMQLFHRDNDDWRFITLFVYLTDVDEGAGPHQLIAGSHTLAGTQDLIDRARAKDPGMAPVDALKTFTGENYFGKEFSTVCEQHFKDATVNIMGPAGTMFMANTIAIHRGIMPSTTPRLIAWARYGLGPNTNSVDLEQGPLARFQVDAELTDTARNRYVNRLLFECDGELAAPEEAAAPMVRAAATEALAEEDAAIVPATPAVRSAAARSIAEARRTGARRKLVAASLNWAKSLISR